MVLCQLQQVAVLQHIIVTDYGLTTDRLIMPLWVATRPAVFAVVFPARACTFRSGLRGGTMPPPFLVNHSERKGELPDRAREGNACVSLYCTKQNNNYSIIIK